MTDAEILNQNLVGTIRKGIPTKIKFNLDGASIASNSVIEFRLSFVRGSPPFYKIDTTTPFLVRISDQYVVTIPSWMSRDFRIGDSFFALILVDPISGNRPLASGKVKIESWLF